MNTSKSVCPYSIPTNILTLSCSVLSKPLVKVIHFSFSEGTFLNLLMFATIILVLKKADNLDYNNYRPTSLNSLKRQFIKDSDSLLFKQQYGFRNKLSFNQALIYIINRIQEACDNGQYACRIYEDFKKAFDTVNHNILLGKLAHYGVRGTENNWFKTN